ncbi:uncharacterized protein LOC143468806 isoform X1 [Clavelina lepadiformis]|uniref:uncharacterized protein LOC143468806 isoform X1 n=1 Tax=Clavelina lepadiformis TaxID=159417 RepID=UPI004042B59A
MPLLEFKCASQEVAYQTASTLLLEYIQLILYQRSQIPEPVQLLQRRLRKKGKSNLRGSKYGDNCRKNVQIQKEFQQEKKYKDLLESLGKIKKYLDDVVKLCDYTEVLVALGSTSLSIKEAFSAKTRTFVTSPEETRHNEDLLQIQTHCRRFCMSMVQSAMHVDSCPAPSNTRVFVKASKSKFKEGLIPWPNFRYPSKNILYDVTLNFVDEEMRCNLSDSFIRSTGKLDLDDNQNKENKNPHIENQRHRKFTVEEAATLASGADDLGTLGGTESQDCAVQPKNHKKTTNQSAMDDASRSNPMNCRRLSAEEVLDAVLADDDVKRVTVTASDDESSSKKTCTVDDFIWFELPVVIRGFKI